jgi:hypothetical protein
MRPGTGVRWGASSDGNQSVTVRAYLRIAFGDSSVTESRRK